MWSSDGEVVFRHACKMGLEGIISKRMGSPYRSGRSPDWLKMKNPNAPAVKREAEEDWGRVSRPWAATKGRSFVLILSAPEGAYANAALFIALVRKLIDKGIISKEEMSGIVDEAGALLSQGNPIAMRQALQTLRWFRQDIGIEGAAAEG
jgi:hypothetical protein